jgi:hypothetical protein
MPKMPMTRRIAIGSVAYVLITLVGALGLQLLSRSAQVMIQPYVWLLGPPAKLIHGAAFFLPFVAGTGVVAGLLLRLVRANSRSRRRLWACATAIAWACFGFAAYAPGA